MKSLKNIVFFLVMVLSTTSLLSQNRKKSFGIEFGPAVSSLRGNDYVNKTDPVIRVSAGFLFQYQLSQRLALRTGLSFQQKGSSNTFEVYDQQNIKKEGEVTLRLNFDYITLPVLAQVSFGNKTKIFLNAGPYLSILLRGYFNTNGPDGLENNTSVTEDYKKLDSGLTTGLGIALPLGDPVTMTFEVRNNLGLRDISTLPIYNDGSIKTMSTSLLVGMQYAF